MRHDNLIGTDLFSLDTPALFVDLPTMERNSARMMQFLAPLHCHLRPHVKTHKCPEIALRQLAAGARGITCAKLGEAEVMADAGIRDILIANQVVGVTKMRRLTELAKKADLIVAVDSAPNAREIADAAHAAGVRIGALIEVNVGNNRCGVDTEEQALALAAEIAPLKGICLRGVMGYEGFAMFIPDRAEKERKVRTAMAKLLAVRDALRDKGYTVEIVSAGGTGTYNITATVPGITEIQAGSYIVMDAKYGPLLPEFGNALKVLTTVISRPTPDRAILDAGRKAVADDWGLPWVIGVEGAELVKLSEEHATLRIPPECNLRPGDKVQLIPSHCCCTFNLHDVVYAVRDERVEGVWPIAARGRFT